MNRGWRGESHRHYLASMGVRTVPRRYNQERLKMMLDSFRNKPEGSALEFRARPAIQLKEQVQDDLMQDVETDLMEMEDAQRILKNMDEDIEFFVDSSQPFSQFKADAMRKVEKDRQRFSKKMNPFEGLG
ncbi:hypothetical protein GOV11_00945 [Candidatus Woesearchaeota archaeon]|nr:hypothetical protein [Candidatus Woesearchaeota archaeon]